MASQRIVKVGLVQMACAEQPDENLRKALELTRAAIAQGAELVCLPELFRSRYFCQTEDHIHFGLGEAIPGPSTEAFTALAAEHDVTLILSLFERRAPGLYHNTAAVLAGQKGYVGKYRKMHIPDDPRFYEKFYFTPGDLGFKVFGHRQAKFGVLICWDQWYPEAARLTALRGAEILFYPTAIGWHPAERKDYGTQQHDAWELTQRAHAVANGCFVVAVNRYGYEPDPSAANNRNVGIEFWGQSFIAAPDGSVIFRAGTDQETVKVVDLDLEQTEFARTHWPFLRDRRIDAYNGISARFIDENATP
jgi:N-carbamoylputrescine amidase